jgi:hypothetical protein
MRSRRRLTAASVVAYADLLDRAVEQTVEINPWHYHAYDVRRAA